MKEIFKKWRQVFSNLKTWIKARSLQRRKPSCAFLQFHRRRLAIGRQVISHQDAEDSADAITKAPDFSRSDRVGCGWRRRLFMLFHYQVITATWLLVRQTQSVSIVILPGPTEPLPCLIYLSASLGVVRSCTPNRKRAPENAGNSAEHRKYGSRALLTLSSVNQWCKNVRNLTFFR